ncbi:TadE/TadG family type IV pilus assembly protein [Myceligenerans xiligouense]|uniref:TadE/TadG family type IV pilus assembly protein n=1 Tax=Myceligenerans xiligouense TaxID=253184 RepID=UPI000F50BABA|nr:TadE/TadG family type IV pilus assembly protein [Myceligenerans xiligouense]
MSRRAWWSRRDGDAEEGSASIEVAVGAPAFALLLALVLLAGRVVLSQQAVETAAWDAARSASITRSDDVTARAQEVAAASLANQELNCAGTDVVVDLSGYATEPGAPSAITVTVSCSVKLWDLGLAGAPTKTVSSTATSPTDTWRSAP